MRVLFTNSELPEIHQTTSKLPLQPEIYHSNRQTLHFGHGLEKYDRLLAWIPMVYAQEHNDKLTSVPPPTAGEASSTDGVLELSHLPTRWRSLSPGENSEAVAPGIPYPCFGLARTESGPKSY
jgi:hypothetical protein